MRCRVASGSRALALAVLMVACVSAAAVDGEVQSFSAEPGTDVVLVEDHRVPLVYVVVEFPVGHWSAWATENHAEEAFEIQLYDPAGSLRSRADRLAADLSVDMSSHAARVTASCLAEDLEQVLALIADVLENPEFDRHELQRRRKSAKLDWSGSQKSPQFRLAQAAARLAYAAGDPRRRAYEKPLPTSKDPDRLVPVRQILVRLPGRTIAFAGDVTRAAAEQLSADLLPPSLDDPPEGLEPRLGPMTPAERWPAERSVAMPRIAQTFFGYGRRSLTYDDPRYPAFLVADHVLGGHFFSRLYEALRHEGGETYGATTTGKGGIYEEGYALATFTRGDNAEATEKKLREVLRRFHADGVTEEEREAAVGYLLGRRPFSRQAPSQILNRFLWERRHDLAPGFYDELIDRSAAVSLEEVNAFIADFYDPALFSMIKVAPK